MDDSRFHPIGAVHTEPQPLMKFDFIITSDFRLRARDYSLRQWTPYDRLLFAGDDTLYFMHAISYDFAFFDTFSAPHDIGFERASVAMIIMPWMIYIAFDTVSMDAACLPHWWQVIFTTLLSASKPIISFLASRIAELLWASSR